MESLEIPKELTYSAARDLCVDASLFHDDAELAVDFSKVTFSRPTGMLVVGSTIRQLVAERRARRLPTVAVGVSKSVPAHTYLEHLGFFDFIGLLNRNKIGAAKGSARYIPIRKIDRAQFETKGRNSKQVRDEILEFSKDISAVVAAGFEDYEVHRLFSYAFKEIIRNVFEHSSARSCFITGQRWESGMVEAAVIDEGCGIQKSLSETFEISTDAEALALAIKPGVSRTSGALVNEHDNSGFGLYVLSEVGRNFGRFVVGSGESALRLGSDSLVKQDKVKFSGTFVGLRLDTPPKNFANVLDDIVAAGEAEAGLHGVPRRASSSSKEF
jgi:hypothetical protein